MSSGRAPASALALATVLLSGAGCAADRSGGREADVPRGSGSALALVGGEPVHESALRGPLLEAAGAQVFGEWLLNREIDRALRREGRSVTEQDLDRERRLLLEQLAEDPDEATRVLRELRERRGLGERRFRMLLHRNAGLRKLVEENVEVGESLVRQAYERTYGEQTVVRLILVPTLAEASEVVRELEGGASFVDLAIERSRDESRDQGGLLPPISAQDTTFPQVVRDTATRLEPGEVSHPVTLDGGFAILRCERKIDADEVPYDQVADTLRRQVRLQLERNRMQQRARTLLQEADLIVLDNDLEEVWSRERVRIDRP